MWVIESWSTSVKTQLSHCCARRWPWPLTSLWTGEIKKKILSKRIHHHTSSPQPQTWGDGTQATHWAIRKWTILNSVTECKRKSVAWWNYIKKPKRKATRISPLRVCRLIARVEIFVWHDVAKAEILPDITDVRVRRRMGGYSRVVLTCATRTSKYKWSSHE